MNTLCVRVRVCACVHISLRTINFKQLSMWTIFLMLYVFCEK
jgi:hypothetical protein